MPNYDYRCPVCGRKQEVFMPLNELEFRQITCGDCGDVPMHRQISTPGQHFKGSGWTPKFHK